MNVEMWFLIITGFNVILSVHGFIGGGFPQACGSMLPQHGSSSPQVTKAPFEISFQQDNNGGPFTVSLRSTDSGVFTGFMLQAQEENGPVGTFSKHGANVITLLNCKNVADSVSQPNNRPRTSFEVIWTPPESGLGNIYLRATFVRSFSVFWTDVTTPLPAPTTAVPSTTQPITTPSTTKPNTTPSTTQPITTQRSTQPNTTPNTAQPSTTPRTLPQHLHHKKQATELEAADSALLLMKMELCNIITYAIANSHLSRLLDRILKLSGLLLSGAMEIAALGLIIASDPSNAVLLALVSVAIFLTVLEIVIASLPLGPSHELYLEIADTDRRESWPLWVLIAYTAWALLSAVWIFVMTTQKHVIFRRRKKVSLMGAAHKDGWKKRRIPAAVPVISFIFLVGTIAFAAALIVGIFQLPEK